MEINRVTLQLQNMAASEIEAHVDPAILNEIKQNDPHPLFRAYSIAHEGVSNGTVIGLGKVALRWLQNSIVKIFNKVKIGTNLFLDHIPGTNEHQGRTVLGRVVGKAIDKIDNITHALTIGYILPEHRDKNLNVSSFEGGVELPENLLNTPSIEEDKIREITGIALGSSEITQPAFPGATLQAALQMFTEAGKESKMSDSITFEQVLAYFEKNPGLSITAIFPREKVEKDPVVKEIAGAMNLNASAVIKRQEKTIETLKEKSEKEIADLKVANKDQGSKLLKINSIELKNDILKERKLDELTIKFVNKRYSDFIPVEEKTIKADLNTFIDGAMDELKDLKKDGIIPGGVSDEKVFGAKAPPAEGTQTKYGSKTPELKKAESELMFNVKGEKK